MDSSLIIEIGYILLYVAAFGFSDFLVKKAKLTNHKYLLYYLLVFLIGFCIIYFHSKNQKKKEIDNE